MIRAPQSGAGFPLYVARSTAMATMRPRATARERISHIQERKIRYECAMLMYWRVYVRFEISTIPLARSCSRCICHYMSTYMSTARYKEQTKLTSSVKTTRYQTSSASHCGTPNYMDSEKSQSPNPSHKTKQRKHGVILVATWVARTDQHLICVGVLFWPPPAMRDGIPSLKRHIPVSTSDARAEDSSAAVTQDLPAYRPIRTHTSSRSIEIQPRDNMSACKCLSKDCRLRI